MLSIFLKRIFRVNSLKKSHENQIGIKLSMCQKQEHPFFHLRSFCLETNVVTILRNHMPTDKQCQGSLCLKLCRICKQEPKLSPRNNFVDRHKRTTTDPSHDSKIIAVILDFKKLLHKSKNTVQHNK